MFLFFWCRKQQIRMRQEIKKKLINWDSKARKSFIANEAKILLKRVDFP